MRRMIAAGLLALALPAEAFAQGAADGRRLFSQSCSVCHVRSQLGGNLFGPELSRESLGGKDELVKYVISNGSPRMPGFKHHFKPAEIDSIVAYLKTIAPPPKPAKQ